MTLPATCRIQPPAIAAVVAIALLLAGCATPPPAPPAGADRRPVKPPVPPPSPAPSRAAAGRASTASGHADAARAAPIELPDMRGAASGYRPTAVVPWSRSARLSCRNFELTATPALTTTSCSGKSGCRARTRSPAQQQSGQTLTLRQYVERDWALRRDNNRSAHWRCKVLGGSIEGNTALVVF